MPTISVTLPSDGQTIDAADYNVPINTIVSAINGGLDSTNISAGGVVPNNLVSGTGTSWAWTAWTPTWTNLAVGNGTLTAAYTVIGKTVHVRLLLDIGTTTSITGTISLTLPITAASGYTSGEGSLIGVAKFLDDGTASYSGYLQINSTTACAPVVVTTGSTYAGLAGVSNTVPFGFATSDDISFTGTYQAA